MPKLVVVVAGKKSSGKSTFCNHMAAMYTNWRNASDVAVVTPDGRMACPTWADQTIRGEIVTVSFAAPLKEFCHHVLGLTYDQVYGTEADKNTATEMMWDTLPLSVLMQHACRGAPPRGAMSARQVMQVFGTDIMRRWYNDVWVRACMNACDTSTARLVLVPDARFPNEVDAFVEWRDTFGDVPGAPAIWLVRLTRAPLADAHASETALDGYPDSNFDLVLGPCEGVEAQQALMSEAAAAMMLAAGII